MAGLIETIQSALNVEVASIVTNIVGMLPNILAAVLLILLGWVFASLIRRIVQKLLALAKFEQFLKAEELDKALGAIVISDVVAMIVYYYVLVVFLQAAFDLVYLKTISYFIGLVLIYAPVIIGAVLLVVASAIIGEYLKTRALQLGDKSATMQMLARGAKFLVMYVGTVMALSTVGFNTTILNSVFISLSQAVFFGIALAFGIAFGLGGQEAAKDWIKTARAKVIRA